MVSFDLHTEIVGSEWVGRKGRVFRLDPATLWRDATPLEPDDPSTLVLSPVHLQLQLAVHALKHSYSRLIWLVDLALVLADALWTPLMEHARASGALRPLAYAVSILDTLLGFPVPEAVRWDDWLGVAPARPYKARVYHPHNWRAWQDFSNGQLGDFGCHILDPVFTALGLTAPLTVRGESAPLNREVW